MDAISALTRTEFVENNRGDAWLQKPTPTLPEIKAQILAATLEAKRNVIIIDIGHRDEQILLLEGYSVTGKVGNITVSWESPVRRMASTTRISSVINRTTKVYGEVAKTSRAGKVTKFIEDPNADVPWE